MWFTLPISAHLIPSNPISSRPIPSHPVLSRPIPSHPAPSNPRWPGLSATHAVHETARAIAARNIWRQLSSPITGRDNHGEVTSITQSSNGAASVAGFEAVSLDYGGFGMTRFGGLTRGGSTALLDGWLRDQSYWPFSIGATAGWDGTLSADGNCKICTGPQDVNICVNDTLVCDELNAGERPTSWLQSLGFPGPADASGQVPKVMQTELSVFQEEAPQAPPPVPSPPSSPVALLSNISQLRSVLRSAARSGGVHICCTANPFGDAPGRL